MRAHFHVPIINEACREAVGLEQASAIVETLGGRVVDVIPEEARGGLIGTGASR